MAEIVYRKRNSSSKAPRHPVILYICSQGVRHFCKRSGARNSLWKSSLHRSRAIHTSCSWVWTKRGIGHGLGHGPFYGLSMVNSVKTRLGIAVNLCKQRAPSVCLSYLRLSSVLLAAFRSTLGWLEWRKPECRNKPSGNYRTREHNYKAPLANFRSLREARSFRTD